MLARMKDVYKKSGWNAYVQYNLEVAQTNPELQLRPFVIATFYARLGRKDETITMLEKAYDERDFRMTLLSVSWEFDGVRTDPRFKDLVRRVGLPE